ncbi:hypothetical protein [uncultured Winogradskyella sp.]|uniref:hypothetical protein n=1 Tax=uncultured Winogradskyella sp. TaxID=395353 RepID=UPI00261D855B|nr:hypothetical protein [uncultured Winogradskyella sp.]
MRYLVLIIIWIHFIGCSSSSNIENETSSHLKYFGFAITDCGINYTNQVDNFVNLIDMCPEDLSNLESRVSANTLNNNKVLIHLQGLFINAIEDSNSPSGFRYELLNNYEELFSTWTHNNQFLTTESVAAFDFADEPAWNQMSMNDLAIVAARIKLSFPDIPLMVIEAPDVINQLIITNDIDWVGFDRYGTIDPKNDSDYLSRLELIKSKRTNSNQKLVLIMESQWLDFYSDAGFEESILIDMANSYHELAQSEDDVIALISYLLPSAFDAPDQKGYFDLLPEVKTAIRTIGNEIVN